MFRLSQYMQELVKPTETGPRRDLPGPVVIWNLIRRCNLTCKHCYSISADTHFPGELNTSQVKGKVKAKGVRVAFALESLVSDGCVELRSGKQNAKFYRSVRPYERVES